AAYTGHEAVVGGELEKLLIEVQLAAFLVEQHGLHAVGEHAFGHSAEIAEAVHHRGQQVVDTYAAVSDWNTSPSPITVHCCPAISQTESVGCWNRPNPSRSRMIGEPVK